MLVAYKFIEIISYDAAGTKLRKVVSGVTTDYAGNYMYKNNVLQFFNQAEGYVQNTNGTFSHVYQYKDHLGNIRLSYADSNNNGSIAQSEIIEESNYYPFGLKHKGYNNVVTSNGNSTGQKEKTYQEQRFTDDLGLNIHEWRYRVSDPAIGRFWQIDPLAEDYVYNSTYAFQENKLGLGFELEGREMVGRNSAALYEARMKKAKELKKKGRVSEGVALENEARTIAKINTTISMFALAIFTGGRAGFIEETIEQVTGVPIIPDPTDILKKGGKMLAKKGDEIASGGRKFLESLTKKDLKGTDLLSAQVFKNGDELVTDIQLIYKQNDYKGSVFKNLLDKLNGFGNKAGTTKMTINFETVIGENTLKMYEAQAKKYGFKFSSKTNEITGAIDVTWTR